MRELTQEMQLTQDGTFQLNLYITGTRKDSCMLRK
jgi:hypothetical protein